MRVNILESSGLAKPEELIMYKAVLNSVQCFNVIYNSPTCFSYKITYKNIRANRHTNTNETFRAETGKGEISLEVCQSRADGDDALRYIKRDLLRDTLRR